MFLQVAWLPFSRENVERESDRYGVYELGDYGDVLYVGAGQIRKRLRSHFHGGSKHFHGISSYRVEYVDGKLKALQRQSLELDSYSNQNGRYPLFNQKIDDSTKHA